MQGPHLHFTLLPYKDNDKSRIQRGFENSGARERVRMFGRRLLTCQVYSQAPGLFGRLAGALSFMSPWKGRNDPDDDNVPVEDMEDEDDQLDDGGDEEQAYGDNQGAGYVQESDPVLQAYGKTLPSKVDRPHSGHLQLDESTEISAADTSHERQQLHSSGLTGKEDGFSMEDVGGVAGGDYYGRSRGFGGVSGGSFGGSGLSSRGMGGGGSRALGVSGDFGGMNRSSMEDGSNAPERSLMVRPRGVRKELMMPLRVAQTVSRMGKENILHKRELAFKFASKDMKAYMVSYPISFSSHFTCSVLAMGCETDLLRITTAVERACRTGG